MKLHLPKALFTAVMAVFAIGGMAQAITATALETKSDVTISTSGTYDGVLFDYADNTMTLASSYSPSLFEATITLDFDQFLAADDNTSILYIDTTGVLWGYATKKETTTAEGTGETTTAVTVQGRWETTSKTYNDGAEIMDAATLAGLATGEGENQVIEGLKVALQSGKPGVSLTTQDGTKVYYNNGLTQGSKTVETVYINKNLITSITVQDSTGWDFTNASGTWEKSFGRDEVISVLSGKTMLTGGENGSAASNTKAIVVGGAGMLHLEAWNQGRVTLNDDLYIGSSTYNVSGNDNAEKFGTVRISNDGAEGAELSGNIYLVEDSAIRGTGDKEINISGTVTDKGVPTNDGTVDGNYTLSLSGGGIKLSGTVNVSGLSIEQGYNSGQNNFAGTTDITGTVTVDTLTVGSNATLSVSGEGKLTIGGEVSNSGAIDLTGGSLVVKNFDEEHYTLLADTSFYNSVGEGKASSANGYAASDKLLLIGGSVTTGDATSITGEGLLEWSNVEGTGIVGTTAEAMLDTSTFYINSGTVRLSKTAASSDGVIYNDNTASKYVVADGATLDVYFNTNDFGGDYALVGKTIELQGGSTLTNTAGAGNLNWQLLKNVELTGDATVEVASNKNFGFQASGGNESKLTLNGNTLEKTGAGEFWLLNTTVGAGTIKITEGSVKVINKNSNASAADIVLNGANASLTVTAEKTLTAKSVSGTGTINGGGTLDAGSLTLDGAMKLTAGTLITDAITVDGGTLAMSDGTKLDVRGMYENLQGDNTRLNDLLDKLSAVTTAGTSYVLAKGANNANYKNDAGNVNLQRDAELSCNIVFTNNLGINGRGWNGTPFGLTMNEGSSLKVGEDGTGVLSLVTGATLTATDAELMAGAVVLGHSDGTNPETSSGNASRYHGKITMTGEDSKLTVDKVTFNGSSANEVSVTGGEVEFTNTGNVTTSIVAGADADDKGSVNISDAKVIAKNSWALSSDSENVKVALSGVTFDVAADKSVSLGGSQVQLSGANTVTGAGKLAFTGDVATNLADNASVAVSAGTELTWNADSVKVQSLESATASATVSKAAIDAAKVSVDTATTTGVQAITGGSELTITGGETLTIAGDSSLSKVTLSNTNAFQVNGALVLTDATIDLSGFTVDTTTNAPTYVYTLGYADGGITGADSITIEGLELEGYNAVISAATGDPTTGVALLADSTNYLVLTLTSNNQPDPDQPEPPVVTPLTEITITDGTYDATAGVLTFATTADLTNTAFGDKLNATMSEDVWASIVGATTLPDEVLVSFTDAAGELIDFNGADDMAKAPIITINGEGTKGAQELTGDGTIVGGYVTSYIPEPTTTTLSLLALAGLAVRRRRK